MERTRVSGPKDHVAVTGSIFNVRGESLHTLGDPAIPMWHIRPVR